jgi:hypothetical protein
VKGNKVKWRNLLDNLCSPQSHTVINVESGRLTKKNLSLVKLVCSIVGLYCPLLDYTSVSACTFSCQLAIPHLAEEFHHLVVYNLHIRPFM